jgi:hypothetical protein
MTTTTTTCTPCEQELSALLPSLPSKWRDQLVSVLCEIRAQQTTEGCEKVKECETVTSLSGFTLSGSSACIEYTNEAGVTVERCFDISSILNNTMNDIIPSCVSSQEEWDAMTYLQRIQSWIDAHCECCDTTTTTTTIA